MAKAKKPSIAKRLRWTKNQDGTYTARMEYLRRVDYLVASESEILKIEDLFAFFGIDSAKARKPLQSDIDLMKANSAKRMLAEEGAR